jgi:protoporphyrin/coproporphyrin ferrochelatase
VSAFDAFLLLSFGGPESHEDVMPFLENVTRGRGVPRERLVEVAAHYAHLGGKSPLNDQNRAMLTALRPVFDAAGLPLRFYFGNRNWHPFLADTLRSMRDDGVKRAVTYATSAYRSYSGCRQYLEDIERARAEVPDAPELIKLRPFSSHPRFVAACAARLEEARRAHTASGTTRVIFTAHSIPVAMASTCAYEADLREVCTRVIAAVCPDAPWDLVYQSRSGPPAVPWLEPDILDHLRALSAAGERDVIVMPVGFLSDHVEVIWDLDHEARALADTLGIAFHRGETVSTHPEMLALIIELVQARIAEDAQEPSRRPPPGAPCEPGCCAYAPRRPA